MHLAASRPAIVRPPCRPAVPGGAHPLAGAGAARLLARIRAHGAAAQLAGRVEPFRHCALIAAEPDREAGVYLDAVLRVLPQGLGRPLVVRRPGAGAASFDEAWLVALVMAHRRDDAASVAFGISARIARPLRRTLGFLVDGLATRLGPELDDENTVGSAA